jgi:hypothetical protein
MNARIIRDNIAREMVRLDVSIKTAADAHLWIDCEELDAARETLALAHYGMLRRRLSDERVEVPGVGLTTRREWD